LKADFEAWIVVKGSRHGKRYAERKVLNVPVELALGLYEKLSDLQVREALNDLIAEDERRRELEEKRRRAKELTAGYDPFASQITRRNA
jgi:hypothetical protein